MATVPKDNVQFESFWTRHAGWIAVLIGIFAFGLGVLQDAFLSQEGFSRWSLIIISDVITGTIAGLLFYQFARNVKNRHELMRERMRTIAELNHHIRNALQVIKFWGSQHQNCSLDPMQLQHMKESVDRIEWALREVLPQYPEPAGSARKPVMMEDTGGGSVAGAAQQGDGKEIKLQ
ncbi:MAG: hypothetical protein LAO20_01895 [Acidobacteriia bacterium]|nr:hypothetical protein [Terriglobia bacterium]